MPASSNKLLLSAIYSALNGKDSETAAAWEDCPIDALCFSQIVTRISTLSQHGDAGLTVIVVELCTFSCTLLTQVSTDAASCDS